MTSTERFQDFHDAVNTDNCACLASKINLRKKAIQPFDSIRVLDMFAGKGVLWRDIKKDKYTGIEKIKGKGIGNIYGDNVQVVKSLDLSQYNVIDCDSYGNPITQIYALYRNKTLQKCTAIIYTFIHMPIGTTPNVAAELFGIKHIVGKAKSLVHKHDIEMFYGCLYNLGVKTVTEFQYHDKASPGVKKYGYFYV